MALPSIVTRTGKGSALTFGEADSNFTNLQTAVITVGDGTNTTDIGLNGALTFTAGTGIQITESNGTITVDNTVVDTTNFNVSAGAQSGSITSGQTLNFADDGTIGIAYSNLTQTLSFSFSNSAGYITALDNDPTPSLASDLDLGNNSIFSSTGATITLSSSGGVNLSTATNITLNASGALFLKSSQWPGANGTIGQVLADDGNGFLYWTTPGGGGIASVSEDTTPALGGNLNGGGFTVNDVRLNEYAEQVYNLGNPNSSQAIDLANGNVQRYIDDGFTFNGFVGVFEGQSVTLIRSTGSNMTGQFSVDPAITKKFSNSGDSSVSMTMSDDLINIAYVNGTYYISIAKGYM